MQAAIDHLLTNETKRMSYLSVYNEAVSIRCREGAPLAGSCLDRTALRQFSRATANDNVEAL
eukprot:3148724-Amphidinium_carterae.1